jgi:site-specific recombinase XerD
MATIKTVLRQTELSNKKFPISLRVTKDRKSKFFSTIFKAFENEWDEKSGRFNKNNSNYIQSNRVLGKFEDRALKVLAELELEKEQYTLDDFEQKFRIDSNPADQNVFNFWEEIISEMVTAGRTGNARANKETLGSLKLFNSSSNKLNFRDITPEFLYKYDVFLRSRGGTDGGIGVRMRAIRALYNMAVERKIVKEDTYPFSIYKVSKLKGKGLKRALNLVDVKKIVDIDLSEHPNLVNSRNYFVFSFYTRGMNFADMMKLKWTDISDDQIHYTRSKTKGNFIIKILPPVQKILDCYKDDTTTKYIFPILSKDKLSPTQLEYRKKKMLLLYNKQLKEISTVCGINKPLSSYVARHSFANCLKQKGVATDIISESMGHQNLTVTQAYLKELESSVLDNACEMLL